MKAGTKYSWLLLALIIALFLSAQFEATIKDFAKVVFESRFIAIGLTVIAFSVSFVHRIRYSRYKIKSITYDQFQGFGGELLSFLAAPVTLVGSWSLLRGYVLQKSHDIVYFVNFSEVDLTFICLVSGFFFIASAIAIWRQFKEIRRNVNSIQPAPQDDSNIIDDGQIASELSVRSTETER